MHGTPWPGGTVCEVLVINAAHDLEMVRRETFPGGDISLVLDLPASAVAVLKLAGVKR